MITLTLASIEAAVLAAFDHWLDQQPNSFNIQLEGHTVQVTIQLVGDRFNCGIPGYNMANSDVAALGLWVPNYIQKNGNQGQLAPCVNQTVNVWLIGGVYVMFNFHVNLVNPC